jgi:alkaline phosphatase D
MSGRIDAAWSACAVRRLSSSTLFCALVLLVLSLALSTGTRAEPQAKLSSPPIDSQQAVSRVAFGSCYKASRGNAGIWNAIADWSPDLFLFAGDTLYPDEDDTSAELPGLRAAYAALAQLEEFAMLRAGTPVWPVWDDHDFGRNDGGADFAFREQSEALFESSWMLASDDPRRQRPGVYFSEILGAEDQRVQIVMLDTRFFRSPLQATDEYGARGKERYLPDPDPGKTMLGAAQWDWLAQRLQEPAELRLIVSSVQVLADGHGWEGWRQLPAERERLFTLLRENNTAPVVLLSGDRHVAGFYQRDIGLQEPLLEFTSSALNNTIPFPYRRNTLAESGPARLGDLYGEANFGSLTIDWAAKELTLTLHNANGEAERTLTRSLKPGL